MSNGVKAWWRVALTLKDGLTQVAGYLTDLGVHAFVWGVDLCSNSYGERQGRTGGRVGAKLWRVGKLESAYSMASRDKCGIYELLMGHQIGIVYFDIDLAVAPQDHEETDLQEKVSTSKTIILTIGPDQSQRWTQRAFPPRRATRVTR